ncbi:MAG: BlaI/MecI/CopY family transcriptional regulator [Clostridia bacterium]|jgi:BlaI family penicillinase repressor
MKEIPGISKTEWVVMKAIWTYAPCTSRKIIDELSKSTKWKPKTIKSMINMLVKKNAVGVKDEEKAYIYYPLVTEEECVKSESKSFLDRVFAGKTNAAIANFIKSEKMSDEEIDQLRKILNDKEK